jgi:hypothetical protein
MTFSTDLLQSDATWEPETLPIRIRPGAPQSIRLLQEHPWESEGAAADEADGAEGISLAAILLQSGQELAPFQVRSGHPRMRGGSNCQGEALAARTGKLLNMAVLTAAALPALCRWPPTIPGAIQRHPLTLCLSPSPSSAPR